MQMVAITGAETKEGRSMVTALLHDGGFKVHVSLGDLSFPVALQLQAARAETVLLDSWDASRMDRAVKGAHSCFIVTATNFHHNELEFLNGQVFPLLTVRFSIGTSWQNCTSNLAAHTRCPWGALPARHMDAKAIIDDYMTKIGLLKTEISMPFFFENILSAFKPIAAGQDTYRLVLHLGDTAMDDISVAPCNAIVVSTQKNPHCCIGKSWSMSAAHLTICDYATSLSQRLHPKAFRYSQVRLSSLMSLCTKKRRWQSQRKKRIAPLHPSMAVFI
uniref:NmrA-like family domain-containing protein 1 n=1 Tax=Terrapene triunguis TaxID=2587831 RepID=A0A674J936_9SAUR